MAIFTGLQRQQRVGLACVVGVLLLWGMASLVQAATVTFTSSGSWTAPAGVTSVAVEAWGGGGAGGGQNQSSDGGGGGGGGAYSKATSIAVTPGTSYTVTVGVGGLGVASGTGGTGGDSSFINTTTVLARGGAGGAPSAGTPPAGGAGGAAAAGVGATKFSGGTGGRGRDNNTGRGGPGGSSAGTAANGTSGLDSWSTTTASDPPSGGGIGGDGGGGGSNGAAPVSGVGGGGGGSGDGNNRTGGAGAAGAVVITYVGAPAVTTGAASLITSTDATFNGTVTSDAGASTTVTFEYGLTTAYGSTVTASASPVAAGASGMAVSAAVTGLTASTLYHFRVKGVNSTGTTNGADATFTTLAPPSPTLSKTASSASAVVGDVMTFTVVLDNPTPAALTSVTVNDVLPTGMTYGTYAATLGTLAVAGQTLTWSIPSVPAGGSATLTLAVSLTQQGVLTNTATSSGMVSASASVLVLASAVTHFRMDEPAGTWNGTANEVIDSGSTALHGRRVTSTSPTTTNAVVPSPTIASQHASVVGGFCNAAHFDGNAVVEVAESALFDYTRTLSASTWIYPTAYNADLSSILSNDVNYEFHLDSNGKLYWWWQYATLTSATTIPLNQWTHIAITFDSNSGRQRIYVNGVQDTNTNNWTGTLAANACKFYIGGDIATGSCAILPTRNFKGQIDEVKLYNTELSAAEVQADMTLGRSCSGTFDHIQIEHDGSGSVCTPETVTVKACLNASCSTLYPGTVTVQLSPSGWVGGNTFSFSGGIASRQLSNGASGNVTLGSVSVSPIPAGATRCFSDGAETCTMNFPNASCSFDAVETGGVPQSRLFTKLAGTAFNLDLLALSNSTTINTTYTGTVAVDLVDSSSSTCPTGSGLNTAANITFGSGNAGRKPVVFNYTQAAPNVRVRMQVGTSAPACSSDNFAIRPQQFTVTSASANADATGASTTASPKVVAGSSFELTAGTATVGYGGTPALDASKAVAHTGATQVGALTGTFGAAAPATGNGATGASFSYGEVGYFRLNAGGVVDSTFAAVDSAAGDCVVGSSSNTAVGGKFGCSIGSAVSPYFGRFIPHHFDTVVAQGCNAANFTYSAQPFTVVATARNQTNGATANYTGASWAKATALSNAGAAANLSGNLLAATDFAAGVGTAANVQYTFPAVTSAPVALALRAVDADAVSSSGFAEGAANIRSGRARLFNAYGSELLDLPMTFRTEFWENAVNGWRINGQDACTTATLAFAAVTTPNITGNTCAIEGANNSGVGCAAAPAFANRAYLEGGVAGFAGNFNLWLRAPGAGNPGAINVTATVPAWLQFNWTGVVANPVGRATFGVHKSPLIYRRENY